MYSCNEWVWPKEINTLHQGVPNYLADSSTQEKWAKKTDLADSGKSKIVKKTFRGIYHSWNITDIGACSKNHQHFVANSQLGHKKRGEKIRCKSTARDLRKIRHETTRNPLSSSAALFHNCNRHGVSRSTRCSVLGDMVEGWEAEPRPPLDKTHRLKHPELAKKSLDRFFKDFVDWWDENNSMTLVQPTTWTGPWLDQC